MDLSGANLAVADALMALAAGAVVGPRPCFCSPTPKAAKRDPGPALQSPYGASLHILKVEIGGDGDSTEVNLAMNT